MVLGNPPFTALLSHELGTGPGDNRNNVISLTWWNNK
jgi:hypothetical protein